MCGNREYSSLFPLFFVNGQLVSITFFVEVIKMTFSKTEKKAFAALKPEFRFALVAELDKLTDVGAIAALAQMLEFNDTFELALSALKKRMNPHKQSVARYLIYTLKREKNDRRHQLCLIALKSIDATDTQIVISKISKEKGATWKSFISKLRNDLKK